MTVEVANIVKWNLFEDSSIQIYCISNEGELDWP